MTQAGRDVNKQISTLVRNLEGSKKLHLEVAQNMLQADKGNFSPVDWLMLGIVKRSLMLVSGFCELAKQNNFTCAMPLIRLHLDNLLQVYAVYIAPNPHDYVIQRVKGEQTNRLKDKSGTKMTDSYLVDSISKEKGLAWVKSVYKETSRFIHFSHKHIFSTLGKVNERDRTVTYLISYEDKIPDPAKIEALLAMIKITKELFRFLCGWIATKEGVGIGKR